MTKCLVVRTFEVVKLFVLHERSNFYLMITPATVMKRINVAREHLAELLN